MKLIGGVIVAFIAIGVIYFFFFSKPTEAPESGPENPMMEEEISSDEAMMKEDTTASSEATMGKTITLSEIAEHATADDCWFAVEGKVYDVTEYIDGGKHPGGTAIIEGCGTDATELFNDRPNGSGSHSEKARSFLPNFEIGQLQE